MTIRSNVQRAAVAVLILGLIGAAIYRYWPNSAPPAEQAAAADSSGVVKFLMEQQWLIRMKLAKADQATLARQITTTGRVVPAAGRHAIVAPPVGGVIAGSEIPRIGQQVSRGQIIATLLQTPSAAESAQIRVENARIEAERRRLSQALNEAAARMNFAKNELDRARRLYERKAYSRRQVETADMEFKAAEAAVSSAQEQVNALSAPAPGSLTHEVRAPVAGAVVSVRKALGEHVNPGEAIVEIVNLESVWVEAPIFERDLARLQGQPQAVFTTASFPGSEFRGRIVNLGAVINEQTRAATAIFEVQNRNGMLRIGMQANVRLDAGETIAALLVPKEAVLDNEGKKIVYVLLSGEEFQRREVTLGDEYGDKVAILSGIEPGQRVVTQGAYQLKLQELRPADAGAHTHET
ncbi:MAG: efflux RND transporter periplasmic adaptor subunit [Acidobacteria bacterium]|nr:efflux RND transporter periplasmic adaptor subunit [Acidobacteriota bacterium]